MSDRIQEIVHRSYTSKPKYSEIMSGLPEDYKQVKTLGDLLNICYKHVTVQEQMRSNLIAKLKKGEHPFPGIIGYDDDVVPAINRAILSGHDMLLVGQIGQAKTKLAEAIAQNLLSPIPIVRGTITSDIPTSIPEDELIALLTDTEISRTKPEFMVSPECEDIIRVNKLETKVDWVSGADRYKYILSTPDISVKDLVGQIDAIKIAKKGVELYNIESYSAGQLLQARRSEEHTSELQSRQYLVCRLLLEKKKNQEFIGIRQLDVHLDRPASMHPLLRFQRRRDVERGDG